MQVDFNLQGPPTLSQAFTKKVEEAVPTEASVEFLRYHQKYGHISLLRIQAIRDTKFKNGQKHTWRYCVTTRPLLSSANQIIRYST